MNSLTQKFKRAVPFAAHVLKHSKNPTLRDSAQRFVGEFAEPRGTVEVWNAYRAERVLLDAAQRVVDRDQLYLLIWGVPLSFSFHARETIRLARDVLRADAEWLADYERRHAERLS